MKYTTDSNDFFGNFDQKIFEEDLERYRPAWERLANRGGYDRMSNSGIALTYRPNEFNCDGYFRDWYDHHSILMNVDEDKRRYWWTIGRYCLNNNSCFVGEALLNFIKYLKSCEIDPCVELIEDYEKEYGEAGERFLYSFLTFRLQYFIDYLQKAFNLGLSVEVEL